MKEKIEMYAELRQKNFADSLKIFSGYECVTDYYYQFSLIDIELKQNAIESLYKKLRDESRGDVKKFAELVVVLNHKIWEWFRQSESYDSPSNKIGRFYEKLWRKADSLGWRTFKKEEDCSYYYKVAHD